MKIRSFVLLGLFAAFATGGVARAGYIAYPNGPALVEHLVRHSDILVTNINLTRANGFHIAPVVIETIIARPCWMTNIYRGIFVGAPPVVIEGRRIARPTDWYVGRAANNFRMEVIALYQFFTQNGPSPVLTNQFNRVNWAYMNAMSATYFYIETLRRTYLLPGAPLPCPVKDLLVRRLQAMERVAWEIRELMHLIRHVQAFNFPLTRNCIECSFKVVRIDITSPRPVDVALPYFANERFEFPDQQVRRAVHVEAFQPAYNVQQWSQRWDYVDQGYLNPGPNRTPVAPGPGPGTGPATPVGPGGVAPTSPGYDVARPYVVPTTPAAPTNPPPPGQQQPYGPQQQPPVPQGQGQLQGPVGPQGGIAPPQQQGGGQPGPQQQPPPQYDY